MQRSQLKIISILMCVLFFSDAVSEDAASSDSHPIHSAISEQLQQAVRAMEKKAVEENQLIQALNERIVQLEQKIAALNAVVAGRGTSGSTAQATQIENVPVASNQSQSVLPASQNQTRQIFAGSATMRTDKEVSEPFFNFADWQKIITPYVIPASIGLLIIFMIFVLRTYARKQEKIPGSGYNMGTVVYDPDEQNPIVTDEKNVLLAQKLAALRSAVEQSKQRRKSDM